MNKGHTVKYKMLEKKYENGFDTLHPRLKRPVDLLVPIEITDKIGIQTAVTIKPIVAGAKLQPASCPKCTGKIRLPEPNIMPKRVLATIIVCHLVKFEPLLIFFGIIFLRLYRLH